MDEEIYPKSRFQEPDRIPGGGASSPPSSPSPPAPQAASEPDRLPGDKNRQCFGRLISRKELLFALLGLLGGSAGALLGEIAPGAQRDPSLAEICLKTGIWAALAASMISTALFWANDLYRRRTFSSRTFQQGTFAGGIGGMIAGALAELLFQNLQGGTTTSHLVYAVGWGTFGLVLAAALSRSVPNMGLLRGSIAGLLGGGLGGLGFIVIAQSQALPDFLGRLTGLAILGLALGLAIVVVERLFREASLEVVWAPNESSFFNLGADPVRIGGGTDDEVYVRGLGPGFARIMFTKGQIEYVEAETDRHTPLKNASTLQIGTLKLVVHAAA